MIMLRIGDGEPLDIAAIMGCCSAEDSDQSLREWDDLCCDACQGEGDMGGCTRCSGTGYDPIRHPDLIAGVLQNKKSEVF